MNESTRKTMFSSNTDNWETPDWLFKRLDADYHFTLDPCATFENKKCFKFYTEKEDGLNQSWRGERVFINPPYSQVAKWAQKAKDEAWWGKDLHDSCLNRTITVLLVPSRTDTKWFHSIVNFADRLLFIRGRLRFSGSKNTAPFPSLVMVFDPPNWIGYPKVGVIHNFIA